jgi:serine/threonine protein kinase
VHSYPINPITHGDLTGVCKISAYFHFTSRTYSSKSNVLILRNMTACIADFGLSSMLGDLQAGTTYLAATAMYPGAVRWTAPELLESDDLQPTTLSDIYSLGSIMLQVSIPKGLERPRLTMVFSFCRFYREKCHGTILSAKSSSYGRSTKDILRLAHPSPPLSANFGRLSFDAVHFHRTNGLQQVTP